MSQHTDQVYVSDMLGACAKVERYVRGLDWHREAGRDEAGARRPAVVRRLLADRRGSYQGEACGPSDGLVLLRVLPGPGQLGRRNAV